jgi:AraC family transcriptional activator of pobA
LPVERPQEAIFTLFSGEFWQGSGWASSPGLAKSSLFRPDSSPVLLLKNQQLAVLRPLFEQLVTYATSDYAHRCEVLHTYLQLILHEAQRIGRQFLLVTMAQPLPLRTPQDYADALAVHVNYLNRAVQAATSKTTPMHLAERLVLEATNLLQHSHWSIGDIADALGFAYPTYFNKFFKKHTGCTPLQVRHATLQVA